MGSGGAPPSILGYRLACILSAAVACSLAATSCSSFQPALELPADSGPNATDIIEAGELPPARPARALHWTDIAANAPTNWSAISVASDGLHLAACAFGGDIYTSKDAGLTWTDQKWSGQKAWVSVSCSADFTRIYACANGNLGGIYRSADGGMTWLRSAADWTDWHGIACSVDGGTIAACAILNGAFQTVFVSRDLGLNWTYSVIKNKVYGWHALSPGARGKLVAGLSGDAPFMYLSKDGGNSFGGVVGAGSVPWTSVALSADGSYIAAAASGGAIYESSDGGLHWTEEKSAGARTWGPIAYSADGTQLVAWSRDGHILRGE